MGDNTAERYLLQRCRSRRGWNSCVLDYTENGLCPVTIVDADGSTHTFSIEMPAEDAVVSVARFDSNKQLIVRDTLGGLYGIDCTDGNKTVTFEIDEDTYIPYFDVVGTNCYIVTSDKVLCYDDNRKRDGRADRID